MTTRDRVPMDFLILPNAPHSLASGERIPIGYWDPEILSVAQQHGGVPIVLMMWPDDLRHFLEAKDTFVLLRLLRDQLSNFTGMRNPSDMVPLPDDAFITQFDSRVPKDLFLRLAKAKVFSTSRFGKLVVAQWGQVRAALRAREEIPVKSSDDVSDLCAELGLARKDG